MLLALEVPEAREEFGIELHDRHELQRTILLGVLRLPEPARGTFGRDRPRARGGAHGAITTPTDLQRGLLYGSLHRLEVLALAARSLVVGAVVVVRVDGDIERAAIVAATRTDHLLAVDRGVGEGRIGLEFLPDLGGKRRSGLGHGLGDGGLGTRLGRTSGDATVALSHPAAHRGGELDGPREGEEGHGVLIILVLEKVARRLAADAHLKRDDDVGNLRAIETLGQSDEGDLSGGVVHHAGHLNRDLPPDEGSEVLVVDGLAGAEHNQTLLGEAVGELCVLKELGLRGLVQGDDHRTGDHLRTGAIHHDVHTSALFEQPLHLEVGVVLRSFGGFRGSVWVKVAYLSQDRVTEAFSTFLACFEGT